MTIPLKDQKLNDVLNTMTNNNNKPFDPVFNDDQTTYGIVQAIYKLARRLTALENNAFQVTEAFEDDINARIEKLDARLTEIERLRQGVFTLNERLSSLEDNVQANHDLIREGAELLNDAAKTFSPQLDEHCKNDDHCFCSRTEDWKIECCHCGKLEQANEASHSHSDERAQQDNKKGSK